MHGRPLPINTRSPSTEEVWGEEREASMSEHYYRTPERNNTDSANVGPPLTRGDADVQSDTRG